MLTVAVTGADTVLGQKVRALVEAERTADPAEGSPPSGASGASGVGGSNGSVELERQILYGPTLEDFQQPDFASKVAADGALYLSLIHI